MALPLERRTERLSLYVAEAIRVGWRPESITAHAAHMVRGRRANHGFHAIGVLLTCGFWLPFWAFYALVMREERATLSVGPRGECVWSKPVSER